MDFLFSSKDFFYSIFIIIIFYLEKRRFNSYSFYIFLKAGFFKGKTYISYLLFLIIRRLRFFEYIFVFTAITSYRYNKNKGRLPNKNWFNS